MSLVYPNKRIFFSKVIGHDDTVLDVGFWGQAVTVDDPKWVHRILLDCAKEVYGVDLVFDSSKLEHIDHYQHAGAEEFSFDQMFDIIVASELIEHLTNPGLFLAQCKKHLGANGMLILTTPNAFSFMNSLQKLVKKDPPVNVDHTVYFNLPVLTQLLKKCGFRVEKHAYIASFPEAPGWKRAILRSIYRFIIIMTPKYAETLVVIAKPM